MTAQERPTPYQRPATGSRGRPVARRQQLPEEVANYVRDQIITGEVRPGEYLRMEPIAEAIGVSNTPVREGLLMLKSEGFVRLVPRRGFVVETFLPDDIRDLFWAQSVLAGELAARAAERIDDAGLEQLENLLSEYDRAVAASDGEAVADLAHQFHRVINLAAQSNRLALLQGAVVKYLPSRFYAMGERQSPEGNPDHEQIVAALKARDPHGAREAMAAHIVGAADQLVATLRESGLWADEGDASI